MYHFWQNHTCSIFQLFIQRLVARLQNQIGPCSKVFKIISRNFIQKRTEDINIQKEKQNNLTSRFKTNTIYKILWPLSKESRDTIHRHTWCAQGLQSIIYGLLTKREVKMAGYRPSSLFACLWTEVEVHKHAKKERGQYPAILTEQAWSIKDLLYGMKHHNMINVPCGI